MTAGQGCRELWKALCTQSTNDHPLWLGFKKGSTQDGAKPQPEPENLPGQVEEANRDSASLRDKEQASLSVLSQTPSLI
jgi:hypothetical protein